MVASTGTAAALTNEEIFRLKVGDKANYGKLRVRQPTWRHTAPWTVAHRACPQEAGSVNGPGGLHTPRVTGQEVGLLS
jgi:hypothetical protein